MDDSDSGTERQLNIQIGEDNLVGTYANFANISFSDYEFTLTFARIDHEVSEGDIPGIVVSRVNMPDAMTANEINSQLGLKKYGVIPAAPELFHKCAMSLQPVITQHPAHPVGRALDELALFLLLVR